jgi:hypothetical protein
MKSEIVRAQMGVVSWRLGSSIPRAYPVVSTITCPSNRTPCLWDSGHSAT